MTVAHLPEPERKPRKRVPAGAPTPQDRKQKKSAEAREAEGQGFVDVEQCGVKLRIPVGENVPLEAYIAFKDEDEIGGTKLLLGEKQWNAFLAQKPTLGDLNAIGSRLADLLGN